MRSQIRALACDLKAVPDDQRHAHAELANRLFAGRPREPVEREGLGEGYRFDFESERFDDVARWIANERRCCPFLHFVMNVPSDGNPLSLTVTGPEGTRAFIDAEIP